MEVIRPRRDPAAAAWRGGDGAAEGERKECLWKERPERLWGLRRREKKGILEVLSVVRTGADWHRERTGGCQESG